MKIKVCGMRDPSNIEDLVKLKPDYIGFIFYPKSKRFFGELIPDKIHSLIPDYIQKIGVFVDESIDNLVEMIEKNKLDMVQLHGSELPDYCEKLKKLDIRVIKAFNINSSFDFDIVNPYNPVCDYYLFDTASDLRGGSGKKFDWNKLDQFNEEKPFFLSGGIQSTDTDQLKKIIHNKLFAIDVNSGFEIEPGVKDVLKLKSFIDTLRK